MTVEILYKTLSAQCDYQIPCRSQFFKVWHSASFHCRQHVQWWMCCSPTWCTVSFTIPGIRQR